MATVASIRPLINFLPEPSWLVGDSYSKATIRIGAILVADIALISLLYLIKVESLANLLLQIETAEKIGDFLKNEAKLSRKVVIKVRDAIFLLFPALYISGFARLSGMDLRLREVGIIGGIVTGTAVIISDFFE